MPIIFNIENLLLMVSTEKDIIFLGSYCQVLFESFWNYYFPFFLRVALVGIISVLVKS